MTQVNMKLIFKSKDKITREDYIFIRKFVYKQYKNYKFIVRFH